ncbi:MAG: glycine--tRNA ligase subunit beta [Nitrospina sp.]|jgi:glycyl-tRNA synthetase beta chain|nr:glycine--tRNA ligase subunit beta [Nitrospina sp.]MBT3508562.1 glycine--tRNA ligase subunit beta [Nitrospina sp.]MBT3875338.1 glycine--tRNA ligase subunit beta [Nitrospina sp.]MBT4048577.1 glycine--tRNA ligase subunit beta [Nitrospina sp.]MBT4559005.1 glycine--tRNA ligase subunit beta [Nitrospina sp.]
MPELFLEIGSEEIPSGYVQPALEFMREELASYFTRNRIKAETPEILGTPRRLVISVKGVDALQEDIVELFHGPSVSVAYDDQGNPTKAAIGFARGKGLDVSELTRDQTTKGEVVCARVEKKGRPTPDHLNEFLPQFIGNIPFSKKMRWADKARPFARPLHWITALFDGEPLDFSFDGIPCGNFSLGHRFLKPDKFQVKNLSSYLEESENHFLLVNPEIRKQKILEQVQNLAREAGGLVEEDSELLSIVNYLVEFPVAIRGDFDSHFLELPKELLVMTMKYHQKYFPVTDGKGNLLPCFITISNMPAGEGQEIKKGNERVLRARLEDARFFYNEDKKKNLDDFVEPLKGVVFQKKLGTLYEKMERICGLSGILSTHTCPDKKSQALRAGRLCKADLVTLMVYEFPELQGVMGGYYAAHSGEESIVSQAILEHYRPAFAGDDLPASELGTVIAVADKLDTILGCIGVGLIPSGSEDPYGLRRNALGIIQIFLNRGWQVSLDELVKEGLNSMGSKLKLEPETIKNHVMDLFSQRYKTYLNAEGFPYDAIDCVLSTGLDSIVDIRAKVSAFSELKKQPYFEPLAIAFRRVVSILNDEAEGEVDPGLLNEPAEKELFEAYLKVRDPVLRHIQNKEFSQALEKIVEIKPAVDGFFDGVMVMVEDVSLRKNRLHLLYQISGLFSGLADFSRIILKKG